RMPVAPEIENDHPIVGHRADQCAGLRLLPELRLVIEKPALQHPGGRWIRRLHRLVDGAPHPREKLRIDAGRIDFVETVRPIHMIGTEELGLPLDELPAEALEERI